LLSHRYSSCCEVSVPSVARAAVTVMPVILRCWCLPHAQVATQWDEDEVN
jgi:hypothetical protein